MNELARLTINRWCDWLDAALHLQAHRRWHLLPACFDPDPEKRHLAVLGSAQRHLARLTGHSRASWFQDFTDAAERFKNSPKWPSLGKAMSDTSQRPWPYRDLDTLVISLWPLVNRYNWTYQDLLNVIRSINHQQSAINLLHRYPCEPIHDFSTYCTNVLGLKKKGKGQTAHNGLPPGSDIAQQLFRR